RMRPCGSRVTSLGLRGLDLVAVGGLVLVGLGARLLVAAAEALDAPGLVHQLLLAGEERMAGGADLEMVEAVGGGRGLDRRPGLDDVAAHALELDQLVDGMDSSLHDNSL